EEAKRVCRSCTVVDACLQWAMETSQEAGVWGGLSEDDRRLARRRTLRVQSA
ncbi:MAG: WhiB family transcriptional regulator, partial [Actinobacteria bacterium]|nr:WhiB family transcriptional regulator [Actinomycetota bacterium]